VQDWPKLLVVLGASLNFALAQNAQEPLAVIPNGATVVIGASRISALTYRKSEAQAASTDKANNGKHLSKQFQCVAFFTKIEYQVESMETTFFVPSSPEQKQQCAQSTQPNQNRHLGTHPKPQ
jgi:hypothetical protein